MTTAPAMPTRSWNWCSSCSELRISLPRIVAGHLNCLLAWRPPLRQPQEAGHDPPEHRAEQRADEDRPAGEGIAGGKAHEYHRHLRDEQDERHVQGLQHRTEPQDTPRK